MMIWKIKLIFLNSFFFQGSWNSFGSSFLWSHRYVVTRLCDSRIVFGLATLSRFIGIWSGMSKLSYQFLWFLQTNIHFPFVLFFECSLEHHFYHLENIFLLLLQFAIFPIFFQSILILLLLFSTSVIIALFHLILFLFFLFFKLSYLLITYGILAVHIFVIFENWSAIIKIRFLATFFNKQPKYFKKCYKSPFFFFSINFYKLLFFFSPFILS